MKFSVLPGILLVLSIFMTKSIIIISAREELEAYIRMTGTLDLYRITGLTFDTVISKAAITQIFPYKLYEHSHTCNIKFLAVRCS